MTEPNTPIGRAILALEQEKKEIEQAIETLRGFDKKRASHRAHGKTKVSATKSSHRRPLTPKERAARSKYMKAYWKKRKAEKK